MKQFSKDGYTIIFFQEIGDEKYSFRVEGSDKLTEELNSSVKTRRIKESGIKYAVPALFEKLINIGTNGFHSSKEVSDDISNPIIKLGELCQRRFGANIETAVIDKIGPDHCPVITAKIVLPNGEQFLANGSNKKEAKKMAAIAALKKLNNG